MKFDGEVQKQNVPTKNRCFQLEAIKYQTNLNRHPNQNFWKKQPIRKKL